MNNKRADQKEMMLSEVHMYRLSVEMFECSATCGSSFQSRTEGRHHARISHLPGVSHSDLEGAAGNVAAVEANVYRVNAVLPRDEADGVLICNDATAKNPPHQTTFTCVLLWLLWKFRINQKAAKLAERREDRRSVSPLSSSLM